MDQIAEASPPSYSSAPATPALPDQTLWGECGKPYPTNAWWTPACLEGGAWTIHPLPYHLQLRRDRIVICYPDYIVDTKYVISAFVDTFCVGCQEPLMGHQLLGFDDLSATFAWRGSKGLGALMCPVVQGAPFVSISFDNVVPVLTSVFALVGDLHGTVTGEAFQVKLNNGQIWMIYASKPITLQFNVNPMVVTGREPFTGYLRIALAPESKEAFEILGKNHNLIPIGGRANFSIKDHTLHFTYDLWTHAMTLGKGESELLMLTLPHHVQMNVDLVFPPTVPWYRSIKGPMRGVLGTKWEMTLPIKDVYWHSMHKIDPKHAEIVRGALFAEATMAVWNTDPYAFGKRAAALSRLAVIADELGEEAVAANVRAHVKAAMEPWFAGTNQNPIVYDNVWGGLVSTEGAQNPGADYGSGMYNDHHFQYGYFIYAAAAVGKRDPEWLQAHLKSVLDLVRDYVNPKKSDPFFPKTRHFDYYACHSWASGLFCFPDGKNQESSSEAVNAYYALALLGHVLDDHALGQMGRALMNLEILSTQTYWHIPDPTQSLYPDPFCNNATVGIVWNGKVDYSTWFGVNLEYIHCIQMLPFLPASELLFDAAWVRRVMACIGHLRDDPAVEVSWRGFLWMVYAVIDKDAAWNGFTALDGTPDLGNSVTNALYFIATRPEIASTSAT